MRRIVRALSSVALAVALAAGLLVAGAPRAGAASPPEEADFVAKINDLRASKGLGPLTPDPALAASACVWNDQMIAAGKISHDPNLANAIEAAVPDWRKGGENVGMGGTVASLFDAFVASPGHYANLVDPAFSRVGVCVGRDGGGKLFTTHRFVGVAGGAPPPPATTAAPVTTAAPATTAAPVTAPPATAPLPTAPPATAPPPTPPPPTAAPATAAPQSTASPLPASAPSSLIVADVPAAPGSVGLLPVQVRVLVGEILDVFPTFLHLRLP